MKNTEMVEISLMYERVKNLEEAKEVLEAVAKLEPEMGWSDAAGIRFGAYGLWLKEHGKDNWFEYLVALKDFLGALQFGVIGKPLLNAPEGWIAPFPYFQGENPMD